MHVDAQTASESARTEFERNGFEVLFLRENRWCTKFLTGQLQTIGILGAQRRTNEIPKSPAIFDLHAQPASQRSFG